jgi:hypothetical protein
VSLLGEVQAAQAVTRPGLPCAVVRIRATLGGQDAKDFEAMLPKDSGVYSTTMTKVLRSRGLDVPRGAIDRHRRGECGCPRG